MPRSILNGAVWWIGELGAKKYSSQSLQGRGQIHVHYAHPMTTSQHFAIWPLRGKHRAWVRVVAGPVLPVTTTTIVFATGLPAPIFMHAATAGQLHTRGVTPSALALRKVPLPPLIRDLTLLTIWCLHLQSMYRHLRLN